MKLPVLVSTTALSFCMALALTPLSFAQTTVEIARGNCKSTSDRCQKTLTYCNAKKGALGENNVTDSLKDCIAICNAAENILARNSTLRGKTAALATEACTSVAKSCDQFPKDTTMQGCANEVRKCIGNLQKVNESK